MVHQLKHKHEKQKRASLGHRRIKHRSLFGASWKRHCDISNANTKAAANDTLASTHAALYLVAVAVNGGERGAEVVAER